MTQKSDPIALTDQLAAEVQATWRQTHENYYHCACSGTEVICPFPKSPALVAYEQGQAEAR